MQYVQQSPAVPPLRSVTGRVFFLQAAIVTMFVCCTAATQVAFAQCDAIEAAERRSMAVAQASARSAGRRVVLSNPEAPQQLRPLTKLTRDAASVDHLLVTDVKGAHLTQHRLAGGARRSAVEAGRPPGEAHATAYDDDSLRGRVEATAPVTDHRGQVVAHVSAGTSIRSAFDRVRAQLLWTLTVGAAALVVVLYGTALIGRRLRAWRRGAARGETTLGYEHDGALLDPARAGALITDGDRLHEHALAVDLQRRLLPRTLPEQNALDVSYRYLPARSRVGGDWFDVIPLPGSRVALVVGDVVGHGLHAAAAMGRLRTAVHSFSTFDLPPNELLEHLDDLVGRIAQDEPGDGMVGATCLYVVYDPVTRHCSMARAGHPVPALVAPDGDLSFAEVPASPPLGVGGTAFETAELELARGTQLVLHTDGLINGRRRDMGEARELLRGALQGHPGRTPEESCRAVLRTLAPGHPEDDVALLIARTRALPREQVSGWDVPRDLAAVARIRKAATDKLDEWGLAELGFTTELVLSELVANAIRHGAEPIHVRLIYDRTLICEVADGSNTCPHLSHPADSAEGGRGLLLVSQMTDRWGTRYTSRGKVLWAEQTLPDAVEGPLA